MLTYDIARLEGKPQSAGETRFLQRTARVAEMVKKKSRLYNRRPGLFWFDLQNEVVNPLYEERTVAQRKASGLLDNALANITVFSDTLTAVDDRLTDYIEPLSEFVTPAKMRELDDIRSNFKTQVIEPLQAVTEIVDTAFPVAVLEIEKNAETIEDNGEVLADVAILLSEPEAIAEVEQRLQRARFTSIFNSVMVPGLVGVPSIDEAMTQQAGIYDRIVSGEVIE